MTRFRLLLIASLFGCVQPGRADTDVQTKGAASLEIRCDGEKKSLALADTITVTLKIEGSPGLRVQAPLELPVGASWILVERSKAERESLGPQRVRWQLRYRFAPRAPGQVRFPFPDVKFRDQDEEHTVSWDEVTFSVKTQITKLDRAQLRDITAIEKLPQPRVAEPGSLMWSVVAASSVLVLAALIGLYRFFRRAVRKSPAQLALQEWHRLVALKLPEQGRSERFITLLTTLLRRYLEREFHLPARRQTTPEFLQSLVQLAVLSAEDKQFLTDLLRRSEMVKFANLAMPPDECRHWAEATRRFLEQSAQARQTLPVEKFGQSG